MEQLFASGRIVDLILLLVAIEAIGLIVYRRVTGSGIEGLHLLIALIPGICLLFALRGALTGEAWPSIALWLAAALLTHLGDLWRRRRGP